MTGLARNPGLVVAALVQHGFPLCSRPFAALGAHHQLTERESIGLFRELVDTGILGRIGPVIAPQAAGASTLAAISCPPETLARTAAIVSEEHHVTHNYERDDAFNLWFVVTAPSDAELAAILSRIEKRTGRPVIDLRLERSYHIDLGFSLGPAGRRTMRGGRPLRQADDFEKKLLFALEDGLPIVELPYARIAQGLGCSEDRVTAALLAMVEDRILSRFGCVIRHRRIGYTANAMAVWDVPGSDADVAGERLAREDGVTLCYRRNRLPPHWPYNLFAMVHGTDEDAVRGRILRIAQSAGLACRHGAILFSRRCFKQRGARYAPRCEAA